MDTIKTIFWRRVRQGTPSECWPWQGYRNDFGYGIMQYAGTKYRAHRLSYEFYYGAPPPADLNVCHHCDNPPCCNPRHLFLGADIDNILDKVSKGRADGGSSPGATNPSAKITEEQARAIRAWHANGVRYIDIAAAFGIKKSQVGNIITGKNWRHLR